MSDYIKFDVEGIENLNFETNIEQIVAEGVKIGFEAISKKQKGMDSEYCDSFFIEKKLTDGKHTYKIKNKKYQMDHIYENGHKVHNAKNKNFVKGKHHYRKTERKINNYINSKKLEIR